MQESPHGFDRTLHCLQHWVDCRRAGAARLDGGALSTFGFGIVVVVALGAFCGFIHIGDETQEKKATNNRTDSRTTFRMNTSSLR